MPPKPKKGKKGKGKKKVEVPLDDIDTTELTKEKLIEFCVRVNEELNVERQHSDFLRLDRDKLVNMATIANEQLVGLVTEKRRQEVELGDFEEASRVEMANNRQRLIHLVIEKNTDGLKKNIESDRLRNEENVKHRERIGHLMDDIKQMKDQLIETEDALKKDKLKLQIEHAEENSKLRNKDKEVSILKDNVREKTLQDKTQELNEKFTKEYDGVEKRKNKEIKDLLKYNDMFIYDLNHYYNKILHHNIKVISELKTSCQEMKTNTAVIDMELIGLRVHNAELNNELEQLLANERKLQKKLTGSKRDQHELKNIKTELESGNFALDHMRWELETLKIRQGKQEEWLKEERDKREMEEFGKMERKEEAILAWEYIVSHLHYKHRETDSTLRKIREIYNMKRHDWPSQLDDLFDSKEDTTLDEGYYQLAASLCRRDQMIRVVRESLRRRGMNEADLGFTPQTETDLRIEPLRVLVDEDII